MEKNLFQQAKELMDNFMSDRSEHEGHAHRKEDKEAVKSAIQAAYMEATPEEEEQLRHLEQHLDNNIELD